MLLGNPENKEVIIKSLLGKTHNFGSIFETQMPLLVDEPPHFGFVESLINSSFMFLCLSVEFDRFYSGIVI